MPKARPLLIIAAFAVFGSVVLAGGVEAHSRPVRFDPSPGAVLDAVPAGVTGWFTSDIRRAEGSFIEVLDRDGANVAMGDIELSGDRRQMSVALQPDLGEGRYVVHWSTLDDADGEEFSDCFVFFVGQDAADEALQHGESLDAAAECPKGDAEPAHDDDAAVEGGASVELRVSVTGTDAELTMLPVNFTPRAPDGSTVDANFGHYHIYLDKVPVDVIAGSHSHDDDDAHDGHDGEMVDDAGHELDGGLVENPTMWIENSFTLTDLEPGVHTVSVVLNHDNHIPLDPPVIASQAFAVSGDDGGIPAWTLVLAIAGGLVAGGVGMKLVGGRA